MEFLVKLIAVQNTSGLSARHNLTRNCTHVHNNYWLYEGESEFLHEGIEFTVIDEQAVEAYGGLSGVELLKMVREVYYVPDDFCTNEAPKNSSASELNSLLSEALKAICLTRDYVGESILPALDGWSWYDAGKKLADHLEDDEWVDEFRKRVNRYNSRAVREKFNVGDWVFGLGEHKGCSQVFLGYAEDYQPFTYLDDFEVCNFRLATPEEIESAVGYAK